LKLLNKKTQIITMIILVIELNHVTYNLIKLNHLELF